MAKDIVKIKTPFAIRPMAGEESGHCEQILRALPEWFGIEEAIAQYRRDIEAMETYVVDISDTVAGFMTLNIHNDFSAEIHVIALRAEYHGRGIGRALVVYGEEKLKARSIEYLQVKTRGPSRPDEPYRQTRNFYFRLGFRPLEENNLWGGPKSMPHHGKAPSMRVTRMTPNLPAPSPPPKTGASIPSWAKPANGKSSAVVVRR